MSRDTQPVATLAKVNRRLERVAPGLELVRAPEGYHYWVVDLPRCGIYETLSVMVPYTNSMPIDFWVDEGCHFYAKTIREHRA